MKNHWFKICNTAEDPTEAEVLIYDEIGMFGVNAKQFVDELKASGAKKLHLRVNSPGGDVFEGISIYNYLRTFKGGVRVTVDGLAASIASVVAMAGKTICMADNAMMMIHNPWGIVVGNSKDARDLADILDKLRDQIVKAYARTGQAADDIKAWMDEETWLDATEAVELGFADEIDSAVAAQNFACFNLAKFKHAPVDMPASTNMKLDDAVSKISELEANLGTITANRDALSTSLAEAQARLTAKDAEIDTLQASLTAKDGEIEAGKTTLKAEQEAHTATQTAQTAALEIKAEQIQAKVDEELAKLGQKRLATAGTGTAKTKTELEEYQSEKDSAKKAKLWAQNKEAIIAQGKAAKAEGK